LRFAFSNKLNLWLPTKKKAAKKKQGKTNAEEEKKKKYDDYSKPGLPDFVSVLVPKLHGIPDCSNTKSLGFEASLW
jgi:hypothetical protein